MASFVVASRLILNLSCLAMFGAVSAVEATSPGLNVRLSQPGLDYAASVAVDILSAKVRQLSIPDQHGTAGVKVGKVSYDITGMKVSGAAVVCRWNTACVSVKRS